jgi:four helix bundle protein
MNKITSYRDLLVWQRAMELVAECYRLTQRFPRNEEFGLKAQMRRAAVSSPSNIAEGHTRHHGKEYAQFLYVALGSLAELDTQMELAERFAYLGSDDMKQFSICCGELRKMLYGLRNAINQYKHS